jgi:hypothetical protein
MPLRSHEGAEGGKREMARGTNPEPALEILENWLGRELGAS